MLDIIALHAAANPDKLGLVDDRPGGPVTTMTWAEMNAAANRLGNALVARGVVPGAKVVWCGQNSIGVMLLTIAARKIGVTGVPLNYRLSDEEAAYVVDHCDATVAYVDAEQADQFLRIRDRTPKLESILVFGGHAPQGTEDAAAVVAGHSAEAPNLDEETEPGAVMIYTSGTTGKPKGAIRRGGGDMSATVALTELIGYVPDDVYLATGPIYHSGPGSFALLAHMFGQTVVLQRRFDPEDWLRLVDRYKVTSTFAAPTPIRMVCSLPAEVKARYDRSSMKRMIANAAPWSFTLKQMYLADFPEDSLWEVYGSTELGVDTVLEPQDQLRKPGSCGKAAPLVEIRLFDDDGREVTGIGPDHPGELFARSANVFDDYHKQHDRFLSDNRDGWQTVGDIAYRDEEGYFYICDRKKDMVISGGMNIYPAEVEAAIEVHPAVFEVAVFGIPDEEWGEQVHAAVVVVPGETITAEEVMEHARTQLAGYKIPRSVSFIDALPKTGSGKVLKRDLRAPYWAGRTSQIG